MPEEWPVWAGPPSGVHGRWSLSERLAPGGLRWGITFSDGRRAWSPGLSPWSELPDGTPLEQWLPLAPFLEGLARPSIYAETWTRDVWLWPLPPPGPVSVTCSWPDRGIAPTTCEVDGGALRAASLHAEPVWE